MQRFFRGLYFNVMSFRNRLMEQYITYIVILHYYTTSSELIEMLVMLYQQAGEPRGSADKNFSVLITDIHQGAEAETNNK